MAVLILDDSLDGVDQSEMILHGRGSKRTSLVYNLDMRQPESFGQAAMRYRVHGPHIVCIFGFVIVKKNLSQHLFTKYKM